MASARLQSRSVPVESVRPKAAGEAKDSRREWSSRNRRGKSSLRPAAAVSRYGSPMKRWHKSLLLCLLVGAVANVGVAWVGAVCTLGIHLPQKPSDRSVQIGRSLWTKYAPVGAAPIPDIQIGGANFAGEFCIMFAESESLIVNVHFECTGWPLKSLAAVVVESRRPPAVKYSEQELIGGIGLNWRSGGGPILPYLPVWRGLIVNTVLYGAMFWLMFASWPVGRRLIRSRRGLCLWCGYDLHGTEHDRCPECGRAVSGCRPPPNGS